MQACYLILRGFLLCFALCFTAKAQIVNIENQRLDSKKEGWKFDLNLNVSIFKNTKVITQLGNRNRISFNKEQNHWMFLNDFNVIKADGSDFVNAGFFHFRYSRNLQKFHKCSMESFAQAQYNRIQLVDLRMLLGTGARFEVVKLDSFAVNLGAFVMAEHENQSDGVLNQTVRYSCFFSADYQFSKTTGINTIIYYQPDFLFPADYRLSLETSLRFAVTKKINFRIVYNLFYDSFPPIGIPSTTYYLNNAIGIVF